MQKWSGYQKQIYHRRNSKPCTFDCNGPHWLSLNKVKAPGKDGAKAKQTKQQNIIMNLMKSLLALSAIALTTTLHAASINFEIQVAGYSKAGWIKVMPELRGVLGGKVANLPQYGGWVTDRVARGDTLLITITPDSKVERHCQGSVVGVGANHNVVDIERIMIPFTGLLYVSDNPNFSNVIVAVATETGLYEKRVPIGSR